MFGSAYLCIGDGVQHLRTQYFPDTLEISPEDAGALTPARGVSVGRRMEFVKQGLQR